MFFSVGCSSANRRPALSRPNGLHDSNYDTSEVCRRAKPRPERRGCIGGDEGMSQLGCNDEGSEGIVKLCLVGSDDKISRPGRLVTTRGTRQ